MSATSTAPSGTAPAVGRGYLLAGLTLAVLAIALFIGQFAVLKRTGVPWYLPALTTVGALLVVLALAQRRSVTRVLALLVVAALAGLEWFFLASLTRLPEYAGPAQTGQPMPAFQTALADGTSFGDADLRDGKATVMVFFRGRW